MTRPIATLCVLLNAILALTASQTLAQPQPPQEGDLTQGENGWKFHPIPGSKCRLLSQTGIAVREVQGSTKMVITMEGGGACYNASSCNGNMSAFGPAEFLQAAKNGSSNAPKRINDGFWKLGVPNNELANYTQIYIPYCSGDFHAGSAANVDVPGVTDKQTFAGYENSRLFFEYIVRKFVPALMSATGSPAEVLLAGGSAGAFGATVNAARLRQKLPSSVKLSVLNDSGPMFDTQVAPSCMQKIWHDQFGLASTVLAECGAACTPTNWLSPYLQYFLQSQPDVPFAFTSSMGDWLLRAQLLFFSSECKSLATLDQYRDGLFRIRTQMQNARAGRQNVSTYFIPYNFDHVVFESYRYFSEQVESLRFQNWTQNLFDRSQGTQSRPPLYPQIGH